ncbi:hypothetical protein pkur_cds_660 [Pandoravirus kuranda]|uniref:Uncharacterized protein n=1 Tax=Pandoravirus kuranda TaxID=3019033 RepID=A0AA95J2E2_9VIRU|nr:hypothetical protein pkur_cds_660 [Pandoravirus kuranda]
MAMSGGDQNLHCLFWHAPTFMRTAIAALCGGGNNARATVGTPPLDTLVRGDDLRSGIFALSRGTRLRAPSLPIAVDDGDDGWMAKSSCEIARHLAVDRSPRSSTAPCVLY